jgi:hypothetical protein
VQAELPPEAVIYLGSIWMVGKHEVELNLGSSNQPQELQGVERIPMLRN